MEEKLTFRRFDEGDGDGTGLGPGRYDKDVVSHGLSDICPTYVHRTPPCQASCPSGHDISVWLSLELGLDRHDCVSSCPVYALFCLVNSNLSPSVMACLRFAP